MSDIMKKIATFSDKNIITSAFVMSLSGALMIFRPVMAAPLALTCLRKGAIQGALVLMLVVGVFYGYGAIFLTSNKNAYFIYQVLLAIFALGYFMPVWLLASFLRRTVSLSLTIQAGIFLMLILILIMQFTSFLPNETQLHEVMKKLMSLQATQAGQPLSVDMVNAIEQGARQFLFVAPSFLLTFTFTSLFLARFWQAHLVNPGGFGKEFRQLKVPSLLIPVHIIVIALLAIFGHQSIFAKSVLLIIIFGLGFVGLGFIHHFGQVKKTPTGLFVFFYITFFFLNIWALVMLAIVALLDSSFNLRQKLTQKGA